MTRSLSVAASLSAGLLFGLGLAVSGMMDPQKVLGFLDVTGEWNPALAFVLGGAVSVSALGYALARRLPRPILAARFRIPDRRDIDLRLVAGAVTFGVGWGLAGFCPGPALASLALLLPGGFAFVGAMLVGMALARPFDVTADAGPR